MRELWRWRGVLLTAVLAIGTIWWAVTGELVMYINPQNSVFAVVMSVIALAFCVARVVLARRADDHGHDHADDADDADEHEDADALPERTSRRVPIVTGVVLAGVLGLSAVLLPPTTLSAATALQRDVTATQVGEAASVEAAENADAAAFAHYTLVEWASLLSQTSDPGFYDGKPVEVLGFVTPSPDSDDVFYVTRFVITHCAVDAQPVGVPVYQPGWQSQLAADDWVQVAGEFDSNQSTTSSAAIALTPSEVTGVDEPSDPYLY